MTAMPMVLAPPALMKCDSVMTAERVGHAEMNPLDIVDVDQVGLEFDDAVDVQQPLLENLVLGIEQALFPLGMGGADGPVEGREKNQAGFMFGVSAWRVLYRRQRLTSNAPPPDRSRESDRA